MIIAAACIVLDFWGNGEIKEKKRLIENLSEKVLQNFRFQLSEVDSFEDTERCVLGFSFCSSEIKKAQEKMKNILKFIDEHSAARVVSEDYDFQRFFDTENE